MLTPIALRLVALRHSAIGRVFATNGVLLLLGLLGSIQLARWLGPTGRGEIAAAMLWPTLLTYLGSLGLISAVIYYAALPDAEPGSIFGTAAVLGIAQSIVVIGIGVLLLPMLLRGQTEATVGLGRLYMLVIPFNLIGQYALAVVQAHQRFRLFNALRLFIPAGYLGAIVVLWLAGRLTVASVVLSHLAFSVVFALLAVAVARIRGLLPRVRFERARAAALFRYGLKVHAGTLSQAANLRVDQALITAWFPPAQLGLYVAAVSAAGIIQMLANAVQMTLVPQITRVETNAQRIATLRGVFARYLAISLAASVALSAAMPFALPLVFGEEFAAATIPALILVVAVFLLGVKEVLAGAARAMGDPWMGSRAEIVASIVTLALLPALLPVLGITGAALVAVLTNATQVVVVIRGFRLSHGVSVPALLRPNRST